MVMDGWITQSMIATVASTKRNLIGFIHSLLIGIEVFIRDDKRARVTPGKKSKSNRVGTHKNEDVSLCHDATQ
jgi:hypothetical protein